MSGNPGLPSVVKATPSASVVAFTGGAVAPLRKGAAGLVAVIVAGVGGLLVV